MGRDSGWIAAVTGSTVRIDLTTAVVQWWAVGTLLIVGVLLMGWHATLF